MKKYLLALVFLPGILLAQGFDYETGTPYKVQDATVKQYFHIDDKVLAVKVTGKMVVLQTFNTATMKQTIRKEYSDFPAGFAYENVMAIKDKVYLFFSVWDKANTKEQLYVREINPSTGNFSGTNKLLFKVDGKVTKAIPGNPFAFTGNMNVMSFGTTDKFNVQSSYDQSVILVQYRKKPEEKKDKINHDVIGFVTFDDKLNQLSKNEIKMPYTESKMNNLDYSIDSKGNVYLLALVYNDDSRKLQRNGEINYHLELLRKDIDDASFSSTKIELDNIYLNNVLLFNQGDDKMICAGFYTSSRNLSNAEGVVMFKVEPEGELHDLQTYKIPVEVLNMYATKKQQEKNEKKDDKGTAEFAYLELRNITIFDDGSMVLNGEQYYVVEHTTTSANGRTTTYYTYHYNDILTLKINKEGEMDWMKKLGKRQVGKAGQGGMSFAYFQNANSHYYLFLDNINNKDLSLDEKPKSHSDGQGGFLTAYKVDDESGAVSKVNLFDTRDVKGIAVYQFQVNRIVQISDNEMMVEVYKKGKEDLMIKVRVKG